MAQTGWRPGGGGAGAVGPGRRRLGRVGGWEAAARAWWWEVVGGIYIILLQIIIGVVIQSYLHVCAFTRVHLCKRPFLSNPKKIV